MLLVWSDRLLQTGGGTGFEHSEREKDIVQKEFIGFPDIAEDTVNVLLYVGRSLTEAKNFWEDRQRQSTCRPVRIMYLIANQTKADGKMLLCKAGYTGGAYREQCEGKVQDIYPFIEFVLYRGKPR